MRSSHPIIGEPGWYKNHIDFEARIVVAASESSFQVSAVVDVSKSGPLRTYFEGGQIKFAVTAEPTRNHYYRQTHLPGVSGGVVKFSVDRGEVTSVLTLQAYLVAVTSFKLSVSSDDCEEPGDYDVEPGMILANAEYSADLRDTATVSQEIPFTINRASAAQRSLYVDLSGARGVLWLEPTTFDSLAQLSQRGPLFRSLQAGLHYVLMMEALAELRQVKDTDAEWAKWIRSELEKIEIGEVSGLEALYDDDRAHSLAELADLLSGHLLLDRIAEANESRLAEVQDE